MHSWNSIVWKINSDQRKPGPFSHLSSAHLSTTVYFLRHRPGLSISRGVGYPRSPWMALTEIAGPSSLLRGASVTYDVEEAASKPGFSNNLFPRVRSILCLVDELGVHSEFRKCVFPRVRLCFSPFHDTRRTGRDDPVRRVSPCALVKSPRRERAVTSVINYTRRKGPVDLIDLDVRVIRIRCNVLCNFVTVDPVTGNVCKRGLYKTFRNFDWTLQWSVADRDGGRGFGISMKTSIIRNYARVYNKVKSDKSD